MKFQPSEHLERILSTLSKSPWVYQMKDADGKILYVGKSKNLKSRVSSYFRDIKSLTPAKKQMVLKIIDIEVILCQNEVEALVLETNLIKHLSPKYNILMKDDKNLAYIKITSWEIPELIKVRNKFHDGWMYYWPFTQWSDIHENIKNLKRIFKIRNCKYVFIRSHNGWKIDKKSIQSIPCMDYYIWICPGPCLWEDKNIQEHTNNILRLQHFLAWDDKKIFIELHEKMKNYAKNFEFEEAWKIKVQIEAMKNLSEKQIARDVIPWDHDVFVAIEKYDKLFVGLLQIRSGKTVWIFRTILESKIEWKDCMITQFLARQYLSEDSDIPESIIMLEDISDTSLLLYFKKRKISIRNSIHWIYQEIFDFTTNQVREFAYKNELQMLEQKILSRENMASILSQLFQVSIKKWSIEFECYDISHTHGYFTTASRVLMSNGKMDSSRYRKYKIKTLLDWEIDDYASHREVMFRRTLEWLKEGNFPNLILIDGWKWQLSSAISWVHAWISEYMKEYTDANIDTLHLQLPLYASIAKKEEEVFTFGNTKSFHFPKWSPELMVLQKVRDESHRFSITANIQARTKSMKKNILEEIPGIGPVTRKKLLQFAGNIDWISNLSKEILTKICTKKQIIILQEHGIIVE